VIIFTLANTPSERRNGLRFSPSVGKAHADEPQEAVMPKFKIHVRTSAYATRYVEASTQEEALAIYNGEVDGKDLNDIEYDYDECCQNEEFLWIKPVAGS
jgi:hypothetical protein